MGASGRDFKPWNYGVKRPDQIMLLPLSSDKATLKALFQKHGFKSIVEQHDFTRVHCL